MEPATKEAHLKALEARAKVLETLRLLEVQDQESRALGRQFIATMPPKIWVIQHKTKLDLCWTNDMAFLSESEAKAHQPADFEREDPSDWGDRKIMVYHQIAELETRTITQGVILKSFGLL